MDNLNVILENKKNKLRGEVTNKPSRVNLKWEQAKEFIRYCGFKEDFSLIVFVLKLFRVYGIERVLALKSWLKDYNCDRNRIRGLLVWKLKKDLDEAKDKKPLTTSY